MSRPNKKGKNEFALEILHAAKENVGEVIEPFAHDVKASAFEALRSMIAGRMSIDKWAKILIKSVDRVKDRLVRENGYRYVGGKLKFAMSAADSEIVEASFELYFLDEMQKWQKAADESDIPASLFTEEALSDMTSKGEIVYEVTG